MHQQILHAADYLRSLLNGFRPETGVILGTGLGSLADEIKIHREVSYSRIPGFVTSTVESHAGRLIFGYLEEKPVVCMQGRFHYYEGYSMAQVTFPVRVMKALGIRQLMISNAAGGMNPAFTEGHLMIIEDHISLFLPENPLIGAPAEGDRFPDMSEPYDRTLMDKALEVALEKGISGIHKGVYVGVTGPNLETRAEYRMLRMLGADVVGMSTVPEVIVARQLSLPVFAVSVITDMCIPETLKVAQLSHILAAAKKAEPSLSLLFRGVISKL